MSRSRLIVVLVTMLASALFFESSVEAGGFLKRLCSRFKSRRACCRPVQCQPSVPVCYVAEPSSGCYYGEHECDENDPGQYGCDEFDIDCQVECGNCIRCKQACSQCWAYYQAGKCGSGEDPECDDGSICNSEECHDYCTSRFGPSNPVPAEAAPSITSGCPCD